jgi:hypothetical protein
MKVAGEIRFELPEPLVEKPFSISDFFTKEIFTEVKNIVNSLDIGPNGKSKYHTTIGRWESSIEFPQHIEDYCVEQARKIFKNDNLQKAYFLCVRYQKINGVIPLLWEHVDHNGTQTTIDVTVENTADWDLLVEGEQFKQPENTAIIFAGQQHLHARPYYPTNDETLYTTVLFLHFTEPNHWIQTDKSKIAEYRQDGDVRFLNRKGYLALPDPPVNQPVCDCHNYIGTLEMYDTMFGEHTENHPDEINPNTIDEVILAPGIVKYSTHSESADIIRGLTQNGAMKLWMPAYVLSDGKKSANLDTQYRNCFNYMISDIQETCHPWDPMRRVNRAINATIARAVDRYSARYSVKKMVSDHTTLLRYEQGNFFHNHYDDCYQHPRTLSVTYVMNDDYVGGNLVFPEFGVSVQAKAGDIILFPSGFPYMHRVEPILFGTRFAAVKWFYWAKGD